MTEAQLRRAKSGRNVAIVLVVTMVLWLGGQWLAPQIGLAGEYAILLDLAAMAAFFWAMVVAFGLWRARDRD
ncbi:MAG: DUF5337 family protein [Pseudomonadota bacterium]